MEILKLQTYQPEDETNNNHHETNQWGCIGLEGTHQGCEYDDKLIGGKIISRWHKQF